jgi:hypothetical protein
MQPVSSDLYDSVNFSKTNSDLKVYAGRLVQNFEKEAENYLSQTEFSNHEQIEVDSHKYYTRKGEKSACRISAKDSFNSS